MTLDEEKELLNAIHCDPKRFGELFDQRYGVIFQYAMRRVNDYALAQDIAAETFLKAFLKIQTFQWRNIPLTTWLYRIATNEVNQYFRRKKYSPSKFETILNPEEIENHLAQHEREQIEAEFKAHQDFLTVIENLKNLKIKYQEVIALRYIEDKNIKEISLIVSKPEGTVKSLLSRGLEKLRKQFELNATKSSNQH